MVCKHLGNSTGVFLELLVRSSNVHFFYSSNYRGAVPIKGILEREEQVFHHANVARSR